MVTETGSFLTPSSALLDNHFHEILETVEEIRGLTVILKSLSDTDEKREEYEGRLYAALTHLLSRNGIAWLIACPMIKVFMDTMMHAPYALTCQSASSFNRFSRNRRSGSCLVRASAFSYDARASAFWPSLRQRSARAE
jgi:hypothetical protein